MYIKLALPSAGLMEGGKGARGGRVTIIIEQLAVGALHDAHGIDALVLVPRPVHLPSLHLRIQHLRAPHRLTQIRCKDSPRPPAPPQLHIQSDLDGLGSFWSHLILFLDGLTP